MSQVGKVLDHMAIKDIFKVSRKTFFYPSAWIDLESIKALNNAIFAILGGLFTKDTPTITETFEEAMKRFNLDDSQVREIETTYKFYAYIFVAVGLGLMVFAFYLLFHHRTMIGWMLALAASALSFTQAFNYDFWAFQIKHRKLGCTFAEWKRGKPIN